MGHTFEMRQKRLSLLCSQTELKEEPVLRGQLELMIHRRLLRDDSRGVGEPLNETVGGMEPYPTWTRHGDGITVSGKHYLLVSEIDTAMKEARIMMDKVYEPLHVFYGDFDPTGSELKTTSPVAEDASLPENVC